MTKSNCFFSVVTLLKFFLNQKMRQGQREGNPKYDMNKEYVLLPFWKKAYII